MYYPATKLVIVAEHFLSDKICKIIDDHHATGYTLVPAGGKGLHHLHSTFEKATVVEGFDNLKIEAVVQDRAVAEAITEEILNECFQDFSGVIYLENVEICRPERF